MHLITYIYSVRGNGSLNTNLISIGRFIRAMMRWIPVILSPRTSALSLVAISYTDPQFKMSRIFKTFPPSILIDDKISYRTIEFIDVGPSITSPLFFKNPRYSWPSCHETLPNDFRSKTFPSLVSSPLCFLRVRKDNSWWKMVKDSLIKN